MKLEKPKRIKERFLIFPFYCTDCGEKFMLEHGAIEKIPSYECGEWILGNPKYYKYCYACAAKEFAQEYKQNND